VAPGGVHFSWVSYLRRGAQGLLQLSAVLLVVQAALVAVVGDVTQDH